MMQYSPMFAVSLLFVAFGCADTDSKDKKPIVLNSSNNQNGTVCEVCDPPAPYCEGDVVVTPRVACVEGVCTEAMATLNNCAEGDGECLDGMCEYPDSVCSGVDCEVPAPFCEGEILREATASTCNPDTGACDVVYDSTSCAERGLICQNAACVPGRKRVFVTANRYNGDLARQGGVRNGAEGAHNICAAEAEAAGIGGQWYAFISDSDRAVLEEREWLVFPYYLVDRETLVFESGPQLFVNGPLIPIDTTPDGARLPASQPIEMQVWTGTGGSGSVADVVWDCKEWTDGTSGEQGVYGFIDDDLPFTAAWTYLDSGPCSQLRRLYCFEL